VHVRRRGGRFGRSKSLVDKDRLTFIGLKPTGQAAVAVGLHGDAAVGFGISLARLAGRGVQVAVVAGHFGWGCLVGRRGGGFNAVATRLLRRGGVGRGDLAGIPRIGRNTLGRGRLRHPRTPIHILPRRPAD
jgi:hypothetical protein